MFLKFYKCVLACMWRWIKAWSPACWELPLRIQPGMAGLPVLATSGHLLLEPS